jgi:hypothetical protein
MACFSLGWLEQVLVWIVVLVAVFAIVNLLIPFVLSQASGALGAGVNVIIAALRIVLWAVIAIVVIYVCFDLISCLLSHTGGLALPRSR